MTTTIKTPKVHVVLRRQHSVASVLALAKTIATGIAGNPGDFPSPTPPLVQFNSDISALETAQTDALTRAKGAVQARDAKLAFVITDLNQLRTYVEKVADADPANGLAIANAAGMGIRKLPTTKKNDLNVKAGKVSGTLTISARVGTKQKVAHDWEYSTDGGKTWITMPSTTQAKTTLIGLTPGTTVNIRHRELTSKGAADWGSPVPMFVV
jgi:hypothetical protein